MKITYNEIKNNFKKWGNLMKTLILNGSPRKNGDTMTWVNEFIKQ